ncbi:CxxC motif-containing protein [Clostridium tetanomorphum]|uniref:DUF1667 domain-containing protein n=1 Tax=Clostridium tetanomorphum TaxID=1553 RepID=A0A923EDH5_CLOTT|nr:DUF1667 domain-containing protein [Clostridium tetanomorphum]KAJ49351.1 hypothetical protein CTM_23549 [Clostridium tetanomorphum DSM 665]KAJ53326.1 hypothetical protein CTM_03509 [Clostridium tetanomorphum DSM 665]MBC2400086.1 DUF1667 domain-containing protein [Clostridium tetanomorphum]MBP1866277.1 CxxC motif-containing protein [Clostridium tetanomorphum]NRS86047.1 CxxC motif-containing protein [Clostridium tetanomorphum]
MEVRNLTCIGCPMGCALKVELKDSKVEKVTGNSCKIGIDYAKKECTNPTRIVTSSVLVEDGEIDMLPVKTQRDIPKNKISSCMKCLKGVVVKAPINIGDVILENVSDTGVNIIATRSIKKKFS